MGRELRETAFINGLLMVTIISLYYNSARPTGANKRFQKTCEYFKGIGAVEVVLKGGETVPNIPAESCKYVPRFDCLPSWLRRILHWFILQVILRSSKANLIINDFMPVPFFGIGYKLHLQLVHDLRNFTEYRRAKSRNIAFWWQIRQWRKCRSLVTVSEYTKASIVKNVGVSSDSIIVSYNGVDDRYLRRRRGVIERDFDFIFVGGFEVRKNHMRLLEALSWYAELYYSFKAVFIGPDLGTRDAVKSRITALRLDKFVDVVEENPGEEELIAYYDRSKVFVSPSLYEGFGMPIIEAMARGVNIVCSDISPFREVAAGRARYFDPLIVKSILAALVSADKEFNQENTRYAAEFFRWSKVLKPIHEFSLSNAGKR